MRINKKELTDLIKTVLKEETEAERARYGMQSALNDPRARLDRGLYADMYAAAREEDRPRTSAAPAKSAPASTSKSSSSKSGAASEADLNNPMIASLFSPDELEQLRSKIRTGGAAASKAADDVSSKLSDAAEQLRSLASRFGLLEQKLIEKLVREEVKKVLK